MLKIALVSEKFSQSPYEYLFNNPLKLAVDNLCFDLICEAMAERKETPDQYSSGV